MKSDKKEEPVYHAKWSSEPDHLTPTREQYYAQLGMKPPKRKRLPARVISAK